MVSVIVFSIAFLVLNQLTVSFNKNTICQPDEKILRYAVPIKKHLNPYSTNINGAPHLKVIITIHFFNYEEYFSMRIVIGICEK